MIFKTKNLQEVCSKILPAVETSEMSSISDVLQLKARNGILTLAVTNREYYVEVSIDTVEDVDFNATVNASLFLKLVSQLTAEDIEMVVDGNVLKVKANGVYKFPLIFDDDKLMELPTIELENVVKEFDIPSSILNSILTYNVRELDKGTIVLPVQRMFYVDENGAITFTTGACVNSFELAEPVRILLNKRLVKLFKLFKDCPVHFKLAYDAYEGSDELIQTKVMFETGDITITSILTCDNNVLSQVTVSAIRGRANNVYPYSVVINKNELMQTLNRLMLFTSSSSEIEVKSNIMFTFGVDGVVVSDVRGDNQEKIKYLNEVSGLTNGYKAVLDIVDLKMTLETCNESTITMAFGDGSAFVISRGNIKNVIPEVIIVE